MVQPNLIHLHYVIWFSDDTKQIKIFESFAFFFVHLNTVFIFNELLMFTLFAEKKTK